MQLWLDGLCNWLAAPVTYGTAEQLQKGCSIPLNECYLVGDRLAVPVTYGTATQLRTSVVGCVIKDVGSQLTLDLKAS